mgnify:CR=1 FL=1
MARPSKYTPELVKRIRQYIADGLTVRDACYGVGISEDTFCRWQQSQNVIIDSSRIKGMRDDVLRKLLASRAKDQKTITSVYQAKALMSII